MEYSQSDYMKHYIIEALFKLMAKQDYNSVTITDIAKKAGVGRATFYRYFKSKEEIINYYFEKNKTDFQSLINFRPRCAEDHREIITRIMKTLYTNREQFKLLRKAHLEYLYLDYLNKNFIGFFSENLSEDNIYNALTYAGALYNVSMHWVKNNCETPVEHVIQALFNNCFGG